METSCGSTLSVLQPWAPTVYFSFCLWINYSNLYWDSAGLIFDIVNIMFSKSSDNKNKNDYPTNASMTQTSLRKGPKGCIFLNWSTVDLQYCTNLWWTAEWLSDAHIHILFPLWFILGDRMSFPVLDSGTLFIHSKCNGLHLPSPDSQCIPPRPCLGNHKFEICVCEPVSFLLLVSFVPYFRF